MPCYRCRERGKTWAGSDPKCAFENEHEFSPDNWNCATANAIRDLWPDDWSDEQGHPHSFSRRYDDQNAAAISIAEIELETDYANTLWVGWYKRRGCTEDMWLLGEGEPRRPSLSDCEAILAHFENQQRN